MRLILSLMLALVVGACVTAGRPLSNADCEEGCKPAAVCELPSENPYGTCECVEPGGYCHTADDAGTD